MKLLVDGKEVAVQNDVKILSDDVLEEFSVEITANYEGVITEVFEGDNGIATWYSLWADFIPDGVVV